MFCQERAWKLNAESCIKVSVRFDRSTCTFFALEKPEKEGNESEKFCACM